MPLDSRPLRILSAMVLLPGVQSQEDNTKHGNCTLVDSGATRFVS
jgi:hypothetical protein